MSLTFLHFILIIHVDLKQPDEHPKQDTQKLQVGASFSHLAKERKEYQ